MPDNYYHYVVVGAGLAGASAVEGIRELDSTGSILLIGDEKHLPYHRPDLSKKLWLGKKKVEDIFIKDRSWYDANGVALALSTRIAAVDTGRRRVTAADGSSWRYDKLLLATGGTPSVLQIPGGSLTGVHYYRRLDDYLTVRQEIEGGQSALIIGGGFIGSEMAAALAANGLPVTMLFRSPHLCAQVFPRELALALEERFRQRGIRIIAGAGPVSLDKKGAMFITRTSGAEIIESNLVIAGVGITPHTDLAARAKIEVSDGIHVDEQLRTSAPDIWAAGDNALAPYPVLGSRQRMEHWDNARAQGTLAGRNMAGAGQPMTYLPYFFSDLFEFGYEAVGEVSTRHQTFADWKVKNHTGVIYYLAEGRVRGVMLCNVWDRVEAARAIIASGKAYTPADLTGAIR